MFSQEVCVCECTCVCVYLRETACILHLNVDPCVYLNVAIHLDLGGMGGGFCPLRNLIASVKFQYSPREWLCP